MKIMKFAENLLKIISMFLLSVLVIVVFAQVFSRTVFGVSFTVIEELSMVLLAWCSFLSAAYAVRKKAHVAVDYFVEKLPSAIQDILGIVIDISLFLSISYTLKFAIDFAQRRMMMKMVMMPIPSGILYYSFVVGMFFICIFLLDDIIQRIQHFKVKINNKEKMVKEQ